MRALCKRIQRRLPRKLLFTAVYGGFVLLMAHLGMRCLFLRLLHVPCPGCGMTRAMLSLLRLDFAAAAAYHPVVFALPLMYLYFLADGSVFSRRTDRVVWCIIGAGFALHWLRLLVG